MPYLGAQPDMSYISRNLIERYAIDYQVVLQAVDTNRVALAQSGLLLFIGDTTNCAVILRGRSE